MISFRHEGNEHILTISDEAEIPIVKFVQGELRWTEESQDEDSTSETSDTSTTEPDSDGEMLDFVSFMVVGSGSDAENEEINACD